MPKVTHILFLPQGVEIELIFALRTAVSKIRANFQNCHLWVWNLAMGQSARNCKYTLFLPQGCQNWAYFCSMGSGSRHTQIRFPNMKLPYLGIKLSKWPKFQKLHTYSLSTPGGRNWAYFRSTGSGFRDTDRFSKLPYLGMKLGNWPKFQKLHIYNLKYSESQILLRFAVRSLVFQIIEVFGFSIGYNGEFEISEKKLLKLRNSKFQKSQL